MGCLVVLSYAHAQLIKPYVQTTNRELDQPILDAGKTPESPASRVRVQNETHSIKSTKELSESTISRWLEQQCWQGTCGSPLAESAYQISQSPYSSTILAICYIEQNHCVEALNNNYWGIGPGKGFASPEVGISAIEAYLDNLYLEGFTTIESLRTSHIGDKFIAHYCYENKTADHICWSWEKAVIQIKTQIENLPN